METSMLMYFFIKWDMIINYCSDLAFKINYTLLRCIVNTNVYYDMTLFTCVPWWGRFFFFKLYLSEIYPIGLSKSYIRNSKRLIVVHNRVSHLQHVNMARSAPYCSFRFLVPTSGELHSYATEGFDPGKMAGMQPHE